MLKLLSIQKLCSQKLTMELELMSDDFQTVGQISDLKVVFVGLPNQILSKSNSSRPRGVLGLGERS